MNGHKYSTQVYCNVKMLLIVTECECYSMYKLWASSSIKFLFKVIQPYESLLSYSCSHILFLDY